MSSSVTGFGDFTVPVDMAQTPDWSITDSELSHTANCSEKMSVSMQSFFSLLERIANLEAVIYQSIGRPSARQVNFHPGDPCPNLLTEKEAIRYLRLNEIEIKNPDQTLQRYRKEGHLRGTQVSKKVFYLKSELDAFLEKVTEVNPR